LQEEIDPVFTWMAKRASDSFEGKEPISWMVASRDDAERAFDAFATAWGEQHPKAVEVRQKDREALLAFHNFPTEHWPGSTLQS